MITSGVNLLNSALSILKQIKDMLPSGTRKAEAESKIKEAEINLASAQAQIAQGLGYQLCKCSWPPQIMLSIGYVEYGEKFQCPVCKRIWEPDDMPADENWRVI